MCVDVEKKSARPTHHEEMADTNKMEAELLNSKFNTIVI
jgi:hypothetical protein